MTTRVQLRSSDTPGDVPLKLVKGELQVNLPDRQLYVGAMDGSVITLPNSSAPLTPASLKLGQLGWLEALIPATEINSDFVSLSRRGGAAGVFGTRTSDAPSTSSDAMGAWSIGGFAINDNTAQVQTVYGAYLEVRHYAGTGITEGLEIACVNRGAVYQGSPRNWSQLGCTMGLLLGSGRGDVAPNNNNTTALVIAGGDAPNSKWQSGIIFGEKSIAQHGAYPDAAAVCIEMPRSYSLLWRDAADLPAAYIRSDVSASPNYHGAGGIVFTNTGVRLNSANGGALVDLNNTTLNVQGTLIASGDISTSTGNVTANHAVIGDHLFGFRTGTGYGGVIGSWDTSSGKGAGFQLNANVSPARMEFGPADPALGTLTTVSLSLSAAGNLSMAGTLAVASSFALAGAADMQGLVAMHGGLRLSGISPYADNAAAIAAGHVTGDAYVNTTVSALMVVL